MCGPLFVFSRLLKRTIAMSVWLRVNLFFSWDRKCACAMARTRVTVAFSKTEEECGDPSMTFRFAKVFTPKSATPCVNGGTELTAAFFSPQPVPLLCL